MKGHNLLTDRLIRFETADGLEQGSLPNVYADLMSDRIESFPALRAHQEPAWHMFLAQLGAIACHGAGLREPPEDAATWQDIIGRLTRDQFPDDEPWCLVVDDLSKPAFLQPPVPAEVNWTAEVPTADALDMLCTSKNHDVKQSVATNALIEDWLFGLINQQTFDGALTNNPKSLQLGIARMNTGDGSRAFFGLAPVTSSRSSTSRGVHLRHDITLLANERSEWSDKWWLALYESCQPNRIALTWLEPWTTQALPFQVLDPLFIEICRVIRLMEVDGCVMGRRAGSIGRRVDSSKTNGVTGDPWAPINISKEQPTILTLRPSTVHYRELYKVMFSGDYHLPICMDPLRIKGDLQSQFNIIVQGTSRKRGHKTEKIVKRTIPLGRLNPRRILSGQRREVGECAQQLIGEIEKVDGALRYALALAAASGADGKVQKNSYARARPYSDRLDAVADRKFFPALWERFEAEQNGTGAAIEPSRRTFLLPLIDVARDLLNEGLADIPCPSIRRARAEARARRSFEARLRSPKLGFPGLFSTEPVAEEDIIDAA